ncbi:MAG: tRNA preQ1(34) S-adenosylmethionine ribosyltransferase-isomerase QueA [Candidatus Peribacteraceae bacterium]|nr:tRNA preQ1(34) S-adenosylmethionine ribosyltransferase-isomerase QueA [Candidatus Peribacteraceae bacterium]
MPIAPADFDYQLPPELIAQSPASPRESARLLVGSRSDEAISEDIFAHIDAYLPKNAVLVLNETKVVPARLHLLRPTGGKVEILYLQNGNYGTIRVLANRKLHEHEPLSFDGEILFNVIGRDKKEWILQPLFPLEDLLPLLDRIGHTPIPPYIKHCPLNEQELRREYQTTFAKEEGSAAAPTASLHFSDQLLKQLEASGRSLARVTLHVGLGTFAPLTHAQLQSGKLHHESYHIDPSTAQFLNQAKKEGRPIIAVGTTVVRTLESASDDNQSLTAVSGSTDLFIREGYEFKFVDGIITNFHVPKSSLLMLVSAFVGYEKLMKLYAHAIEQKYRFFSFGDGMLLQ